MTIRKIPKTTCQRDCASHTSQTVRARVADANGNVREASCILCLGAVAAYRGAGMIVTILRKKV
jgi:hypothetical protein